MHTDCERETKNKSHFKASASLECAVDEIKERIVKRGDLPHVSVGKQLDLLEQLCKFPFGRYIVERKGANGFWTDYLLSYQKKENCELPFIEEFILNRSLLVLAHRERINTFKSLVQKILKSNMTLASIPCGLMRDLITLDFKNVSNVKLVGVDIDPESLRLARQFALDENLTDVEFYQRDAWQIEFDSEFDVITSSGLNVYEPDPEKVLELYKGFFRALKPGGSLIASVLTYPPNESRDTDWDLAVIPPDDLLMEKILYKDILNLNWRNFRSAWELDVEFKKAGFSEVTIHFDRQRLFPTVHAIKPMN